MLGYIRYCREADPDGAGRAWQELHRRHADFVAARLARQFGGVVHTDELDDVTQEVFRDVYFSLADAYDPIAGGDAEASIQRRSIRAWLCRIARNRVIDIVRSNKGRVIESLDSEDAPEVPERLQEPDHETTDRIYRVMSKILDDRERDVLLWGHGNWYDPVDGQLRPRPGGAAALAARWKTTVPNIRKIRERALEKLTEALRIEFPTLALMEPPR